MLRLSGSSVLEPGRALFGRRPARRETVPQGTEAALAAAAKRQWALGPSSEWGDARGSARSPRLRKLCLSGNRPPAILRSASLGGRRPSHGSEELARLRTVEHESEGQGRPAEAQQAVLGAECGSRSSHFPVPSEDVTVPLPRSGELPDRMWEAHRVRRSSCLRNPKSRGTRCPSHIQESMSGWILDARAEGASGVVAPRRGDRALDKRAKYMLTKASRKARLRDETTAS
jgi:hypothetical protein